MSAVSLLRCSVGSELTMEHKKDCKNKSASAPKAKFEIPTLRVESAEPESPTPTTSKQTASHKQKVTEEDGNCPASLTCSKSDSSLISDSSSSQALFLPTEKRLSRSTSLHNDVPKKKIVRFADALGLDLEEVKRFVQNKAPVVPSSAFDDLKLEDDAPRNFQLPSGNSPAAVAMETRLAFLPQFQQPGADAYFMDKLCEQKVCLENVIVNDDSVTGYIRTLNLGFEKVVQVRFSTDCWMSYEDHDADHLQSSSDGFSDQFTFKIKLPNPYLGAKLVFSIRYVVNGEEFWDNNYNNDFVVKCVTTKL